MKTTLKKLVKDINAENAPPDGWSSGARARVVSRMVIRGQSLR